MAEFQEVMKQAKRMCEANCEECPLSHTVGNICPIAVTGNDEIAEIERIVMGWAKENPEPRYPTWKEWQDTNFPNNDALMRPCIFESEEYFGCRKLEIGCEECMNKPIPADIAEKLGIKPIGGKNDENAR